jgi:RNA polymerase primary sigma factor
VLLLDLIQEGSMGLWQGVLCYDGGDFEAHRDYWIRHALDKAVVTQARVGGIGQKLRSGLEDYRDTDQRLLADLGRNPTLEEIAEAMHVTVEDAAVYADMLRFAQTDAKIKQVPEEEPQEEDQAVEDTAYFQMRQRITELLSVLPEQDAKVLTLRFGLEGGLPLTPEQTAEKLGVALNDVRKMERTALRKMRGHGQ